MNIVGAGHYAFPVSVDSGHAAGDEALVTAVSGRRPPAQPGSRVPDSWSLQTYLELGALPSAVGCGRLHAKHVLWEWGLPALSDSVELIVSELLTNAIHASVNYAQSHMATPRLPSVTPVRMSLASDRQRVLIEVWDGDPRPPQRVAPDPDAENGRGLFLVEILSSRWHWYFPEGRNGKVVWAEVQAE